MDLDKNILEFKRTSMNPSRENQKSNWSKSFSFEEVRCLIVCRGPIRLEAMQTFESMGASYGILLSEKDSIVYPQTLAPELRWIGKRNGRVHHISDYMGTSREEKHLRIGEILGICSNHRYTHLFAGYGFMAEDADFVQAVEDAGIGFVGPSARVIRKAGSKDEAKQLARRLGVSVTPGEDRICSLTLIRKAGEEPNERFQQWIREHKLPIAEDLQGKSLEDQADELIRAAASIQLDLISIPEIQQETRTRLEKLWKEFPGRRIRLKHVGGGGGKGQRVITRSEESDDAVMEVLLESKATGPGDNKNFLIEVNIENTRHNEIQLLGNGSWCVELGGRDCSLQMHEQKLQEVSLTAEMLEEAIQQYQQSGKIQQAKVLKKDLEMLRSMSTQAEAFGEALELDSASTFECIVEDDSHFFMEVNTRIQVEHRITEMVYGLEFRNPENPKDSFVCDSLVEAMLLIACHGSKLPRPERILRNASSVEARINATNAALRPHGGGLLRYWSEPGPDELRDDQGIGLRNPDTGLLQAYQLAGAYDSNVALSITHGFSRRESLEKLAEVLRTMEVRGVDLQLNTNFHYGLIHWILGQDAMLRPNTRFVQSYLALAGELSKLSRRVNLELAWCRMMQQTKAEIGIEASSILLQKKSLLLRPISVLLKDPHRLMGWLAPREPRRWDHQGGKFRMLRNPFEIISELYHYLRLEPHPDASPVEQIWEDDQKILLNGLDFYEQLKQSLGSPDIEWLELQKILEPSELHSSQKDNNKSIKPQVQIPPELQDDSSLWEIIQTSHKGFQIGMQLLSIPVAMGEEVNFYGMKGTAELDVEIPNKFVDPEFLEQLTSELVPSPPNQGDEIMAWSGGIFYSQETPSSEPFVTLGSRVKQGDVVGLLEVMKMFNPVRAECHGTIREICLNGSTGINVMRGQTLFRLEPDHPIRKESDHEREEIEREITVQLMTELHPSF